MKSIEQKRKEAEQRAQKRAALTPKQQLVILAKRPGESKREVSRIAVKP